MIMSKFFLFHLLTFFFVLKVLKFHKVEGLMQSFVYYRNLFLHEMSPQKRGILFEFSEGRMKY